jgi:hypothetical protein
MTRWHPRLDLVRLFEALSEEILAATDAEVRRASAMQGRKIASTAREVRLLIKAARAEVDEDLGRDMDEDLGEPEEGLRPTRVLRRASHGQRH